MNNKEPGYVYILTNPSFREDRVKIGKSIRLPSWVSFQKVFSRYTHQAEVKSKNVNIIFKGWAFVESRGYTYNLLVVTSVGSGRVQMWCKANAKASLLRLCWAEAHTRCGNCRFDGQLFAMQPSLFVLRGVIWVQIPLQTRFWCWFFGKLSCAESGKECIKMKVLICF